MKARRSLVLLLLVAAMWSAVWSEATEMPEFGSSSSVQVRVVISEEAARFWRENPVPDERLRDTTLVNEQTREPMWEGSRSGNPDPVPATVALASALGLIVALTASRRLRPITAVG